MSLLETWNTTLHKIVHLLFLVSAYCQITASACAQPENTREDWSWTVDHFKRFGIWESVCDYRDDNGSKLERCYISHVDVFAPRPKFAAAFMFVTPQGDRKLRYEFRFEAGTQFDEGGFAILVDGSPIWQFETANCPSLKCIFEGKDAEVLANMMSKVGGLYFALTDRFGRFHELNWNTEGFADAVADMHEQSLARNLF